MQSRREHVPFDPYFFEKEYKSGIKRSASETFRHIYHAHHWTGSESVSGEGSGRLQTRTLESVLPGLFAELGIHSLLDVPCGDFGWMQYVDLTEIEYLGVDIVPELIESNIQNYGHSGRNFRVMDITTDPLPKMDMIFCRDCLVHFAYSDVFAAFRNLQSSGSTYLLTTTFPNHETNENITTGDWRPINLVHPPFLLPDPIRLISEHCSEADGLFEDKSLGLWRIQDLPIPEYG